MSQSQKDNIHQQLMKLRSTCKRSQWKDPIFLKQKAVELESENPALAQRVLDFANLQQKKALIAAENTQKVNQEKNKIITLSTTTSNLAGSRCNNKAKPEDRVIQVVDSTIQPQEAIFKQNEESTQSELDLEQNDLEVKKHKVLSLFKKPLVLFVIFPWLCFAFYQLVWATPRYVSQTQLIVQQPDGMATMDAGMALLSGLGVNNGNTDTQLVKAYIYSNDMLTYLDNTLDLRKHYSSSQADFFSRLNEWNTQEEFIEFYKQYITVDIDEKSSVISVYVQAFTPEFGYKMANAIAKQAEWFINDISHQLASAQLKFVQGEHQRMEDRLQNAQTNLLSFQQQHNLLNPEAEGLALQQITYGIEGQIATKRAELKLLKSVMSNSAPQVVNAKNELSALEEQLEAERQRLTQQKPSASANQEPLSVSQIMAQFADYKVTLELALKAFTSSQISLEKSRIEAYRQMKYLVVVQQATIPEDNTYPRTFYNLTLFAVVLLLLYGIMKIILSTIHELK